MKGNIRKDRKILSPEQAKSAKQPNPPVWTVECQTAFEKLKECLTTHPVLSAPNPAGAYDVWTDASDFAIAGVLQQCGRPICFYSRKLHSAEKNYSTYEKESLAVYECVKKWRHLLHNGQPVRICTDHASITTLFSQNWTSKRQARIWLRLSQLDLKLEHVSGAKNLVGSHVFRTL